MNNILELVNIAKSSIEDKKGIDIKVLDIEGLSPLADYFIIATGTNSNQLQAISDEISENLSRHGCHPKQTEGYQAANWILMDYGDFMIHLFKPESREFYNLEKIWKDAKTLF